MAKNFVRLLSSWSLLYATPLLALPFTASPDSFVSYLNSSTGNWQSGNSYVFFNPRECHDSGTAYRCDKVDYAETSSLGTRICIGAPVHYNTFGDNSLLAWNPVECSTWQSASAEEQISTALANVGRSDSGDAPYSVVETPRDLPTPYPEVASTEPKDQPDYIAILAFTILPLMLVLAITRKK
jgi:hypothetical protein